MAAMTSEKCCRTPPVKLRDLRHIGTIKQPVTAEAAKNDYGEIDLTDPDNWQAYLTGVYFAIKPLRSNERMVSDQLTGAITHTLTTRYSTAKSRIKPSMAIWIQRGGVERVFHVMGPPVNLDERDLWLEIPCIEEVSGRLE